MLDEIRNAKESKDRPRLHQLRQQDPDAYKKALKLYRKEAGSTTDDQQIPGSDLRVGENAPGQKNEYDEVWTNLSDQEREKAATYEQQGWGTKVKNGKLYVDYMGRDFLIGPKG